MTREARWLAEARLPWGDPRFYPARQHPATYRLRQTLAMARALRDRGRLELIERQPRVFVTAPTESQGLDHFIAHLEDQLRVHAMSEAREKERYLEAMRQREERR